MRFAVLHHDHPFAHWDLLLETPAGCWTWRLRAAPDSPGEISAERIADHRALYLNYEGPVSGDRGVVTQWDAGEFVWLTATADRAAGLMHGKTWCGRIELSADSAGLWWFRRNSTTE